MKYLHLQMVKRYGIVDLSILTLWMLFEGELKSRQMVTWKVRLWDETNTPGNGAKKLL